MSSADSKPATNRKGRTRRRLGSLVRRSLAVMFAGGIAAMVVVAWLPKPTPVEAETAARGPMQVTVNEDGRTRVKDRYMVSAPLSGNLARIELNPGDTVEEGDVLARIVPLSRPLLDAQSKAQAEARVAAARAAQRQAQAAVQRAEVAQDFAQRESSRMRGLGENGNVARQVVDQAELLARTRSEELTSTRFGARVANYEVRVAEAALGRLRGEGPEDEQLEVRAPVSGRVLRVMQASEGAVQVGTPLLEIGDPAALEIAVDVLTSDAVHIEPGARVTIDRWGGDNALAGRVRLVEPSAFTRVSALGVEEQRVNAIIDLTEPHENWSALGDGYRVETQIVTWEDEDVLTIPSSAVFRQDGGWAVFGIEENLARLTPVAVGQRNGLEVEITEGLAEGATVVLHPSDRIADGVEVVTR